ncbi:GNAT family N-acetyltransferase [Fulvivirga sp. 29W222]|uniref:GNAT family N-acetyltransferase n=1 Tax=Fulvivirga marina TaxID=2494733 RepID=A0A937KAQ5_9BACT|nr:GNAT family N-acetyltransferase [Fulvivirga marina]MBL6444769.1 GNAT family N-acetyltransferase [Fulvivirga marina]
MIIRKAETADIPDIVSLLKLSLGESLMPKSDSYWRWKHIDNPFGPSYVLLAEEKGQIIGVRAFMKWEWRNGAHILRTVRAVDTATHPDHQGKGIFKKLTLSMLDLCRHEEVDFVYNTPNDKSMPGYIKMGWKSLGKLPVSINLCLPRRIFGGNQDVDLISNPDGNVLIVKIDENISQNWDTEISSDFWSTNYSKAFFAWRYGKIPVLDYYLALLDNSYVIFRIKQSKFGLELRILYTFGNNLNLRNIIKYIKKKLSPLFISSREINDISMNKFALNVGGPIVTFMPLSDNSHSIGLSNWNPTLGDMEVF